MLDFLKKALTCMSLQGEKHTIEGPALKTDSPGMVTGVTDVWPKGYRSVNCFCGLAYLDCAPTDSYKPVAQCDNKNQVRGSFPPLPPFCLLS